MKFQVKLSGTGLATFAEKMAVLGAEGPVEMARGLNDGGDIARTQVRKALREQMGVTSYGIVLDATGSIPATPGSLVYKITATGKGLPIKDFPVSAVVGGPVTAMPWGKAHTFARSFKTSHAGRLLARRGDARLPVRGLRGPSPAKELVKDLSLAAFKASISVVIEPTIMRRLTRLMP